MKKTLLKFLKSFPISGQCCWKLTPLRPSTIILQGWQLSVGCRVSHRGTVFCRRILTDVSRRFCVAAVRHVLFSSGDQCLSCLCLIWCLSAGDQSHCRRCEGWCYLFPLHRACVFIMKDKGLKRYTGISYCTKLLNVDAENLKAPCQNISPPF